ncbi:MAG: DUF3040 domain-containing protein [Actinomyces sp.]|nr:DUF3040 domain-containing protein [Actinomyces sp.]MDN6428397.1 DUF3040 domain-containing protein [Propionibacterium sp.]MDN6567092.1 DUF3040 domain-containing protein [Actinomyces sp.]MDN6793673.1 DUF3040 domain-containing protein [Propionibacterium sp.]
MALSDYEKQVLEQMEAELRRADPDLASTMSSKADASDAPSEPGHLNPRRLAAGSVLALAGLGVVLAGVSVGEIVWAIALGVVGFAMMVGGVLLALRTDPGPGRVDRRPAQGGSPKRPKGWSAFMSGQERRWERRQDG